MRKIPAPSLAALAVSAAFCAIPAQAQSVEELVEQVKAMRQQLESQRARIDELERDVRSARSASAPLPRQDDAGGPALAGTNSHGAAKRRV